MDLVPVYRVLNKHWLSDRPCPIKNLIRNNFNHWQAVPKPTKHKLHKSNRSFITSYSAIERKLISQMYGLKTLIRILKKLRDNQGWKNLKSFYIQTVFLHHLTEMEKKNQMHYWHQSLDELFLQVSFR